MENRFQSALNKVVNFMESHELRYAIIGGIANQIWGQARFTYDIDIKLFVPDLDYEKMRELLEKEFPEQARPDLPMNPLIVPVKINDIIVDFLLTTPGYEEQIINRAIHSKIEDLSLWICTAEDLIIQKAIANRIKDWQDIEGILIEQNKNLDHNYIKNWLTDFAEILENHEIVSKYQALWKRIKAY